MGGRASQRIALKCDLRRALEADKFTLRYQPQFDFVSGQIDYVDAVLRWQRANSEDLVSPSDFIPLAEETGLSVTIGECVVRGTARIECIGASDSAKDSAEK